MWLWQKHKVEIITAVVALHLSAASLAWTEFQKPGNGLFGPRAPEAVIRHKVTGQTLQQGITKRVALDRFLDRVYGSAPRDVPGRIPDRNGLKFGRPGSEKHQAWLAFRDSLNGADLKDMSFFNADLRRAALRNARFDGSQFRFAELMDADMAGASFVGADLGRAHLSHADFTNANFSGATINRADFTAAVLRGSNLESSDLSGACLVEADCRGANFAGVKFSERTRFRGALLHGARNMSAALRDHAIATGAILDGPIPNGDSSG